MKTWNGHIKECLNRLKNSSPTLKSLYEGVFSNGKMICFEYDEGDSIKKVTFDEAYLKTRNIAFSLEKALDGQKDQYIALNLENSEEWVISFWAILLSGNKPYLVNLRQPSSFTKKITDTLQIVYSLDHGKNDLGLKSIDYSSLKEKCDKDHEFSFSDEFALATSGTSMKQKICIYTGKEIYQQILNSEYAIKNSKEIKRRYKKQLKQLAFLPFYHIFGFIATYFWFTYFGCTMVFMKDYHPSTILSTVKKHGVTHIFGVPMLWHTIENSIKKEVKARGEKTEKKFNKALKTSNKLLSSCKPLGKLFVKLAFKEIRNQVFGNSVRYCISGGSYIRNSTLETINGIGYLLRGGYGASEIGITSVETSGKPSILNKNGVGVPFPSIQYKIEDDTLFVKGKSTCHKIIEDGKEIVPEEWFNTNDVARMEGGMYFIDGRRTDLIISESGENINPDLIESRFNPNLEGLNDFCVIGLGEAHNEASSLIVSLPLDCSDVQFEEIKSYFYEENEKMSRTFRVKSFYFTYSPIKAATAIKVSRAKLKKDINDKKVVISPFDEFTKKSMSKQNELEKQIISLFAEILGIDVNKIQPDSHFINDLGGSSLDYFALLTLLGERFDIKVGEEETPRYTAKDIAEYIKNKQDEASN